MGIPEQNVVSNLASCRKCTDYYMEQCEVAPMCYHCKKQQMTGNHKCRKHVEQNEISAIQQKEKIVKKL